MSASEYRQSVNGASQPNKYRNRPTEVDGIRFASKAEARRYTHLKMLEKSGEIRDLRLQPRFPLCVNNFHVCTYIADFAYVDQHGREVVEDTKGVKTKEFVLKAKLFQALYGKEIILS